MGSAELAFVRVRRALIAASVFLLGAAGAWAIETSLTACHISEQALDRAETGLALLSIVLAALAIPAGLAGSLMGFDKAVDEQWTGPQRLKGTAVIPKPDDVSGRAGACTPVPTW